MSQIRAIEITFPAAVELTNDDQRALDNVVSAICKRWEGMNPGLVMWPFGMGSKITYMPMTAEEEATRGLEFDDAVFFIECSAREDFKWPCAKCGLAQDKHEHLALDAEAGACAFEAKIKGPVQ